MSFKNEVEFCLNFLRLQNLSSCKPTIFSPASVLNSLTTVCVGADGNTAKEILDVIGKNEEDLTAIINYYSDFVKHHKNFDNNMIEEKKDIAMKSEKTEIPLKKLKIGDDETLLTQKDDSDFISSNATLSSSLASNTNDESEETKYRRRGVRGPPPRKPIIKDDGSPGFQLFIANQLFVDNDTPFVETFIEKIKNNFDCQLHAINLKADKDEIVEIINKSVSDATKGDINKIIKPDDVTENDNRLLILINATSFKGKWAIPFSFRNKKLFCSKIPREMDFVTRKVCHTPYNKGPSWTSVGIPYMGHKQWMFIVLPNEKNELQNLINKTDYEMLRECTKMSTSRCVNVTIPAFEISSNYSLAGNLQKLGIIDLFDSGNCDLSKMINLSHHQKNYSINKIIHETVIKVNEYGTGASAITKDSRVPGCAPIYFKADYPFLYFIVSANRKIGDDNRYIEEEPTEILFAGIYC